MIAYGAAALLLVTGDPVWDVHLARVLESNGYRTTVATTIPAALADIRRTSPRLIMIDRLLLRTERVHRDQFPNATPIIAIQPFEESCCQDDCTSDLDAGFDLVFCSSSYRELIAHIRAMLRRHELNTEPSTQLRVEGLSLDTSRHEVKVGDTLVDLTPKEFRILHQFLRAPGTVLSRQELLNRVWGEDYALEEHALDVHIHSLRQKIESDPSKPRFVVTIRGIGYKLQHS